MLRKIVNTTLFVEQVTFLLLNKLVSYNKHGYRFQPDIKPSSGHSNSYTRSVRKVSDRIFLCEHLMDYNLARLHEPTLNLSAHA
jgi:hypothetical protein